MKSKLLIALAAGGLVTGLAASAFAQAGNTGPASPSGGAGDAVKAAPSLTIDDVKPDDPFGQMDIDVSAALGSDLTADQLAELKQRCDLILTNKDRFEATYATFCETNAQGLSEAGSSK